MGGRIYASGGAIGWVEGARDIRGVNGVVRAEVTVEASKDLVDMLVAATMVPPSFDDHIVVAEEFNMPVSAISPGDCMDE